jgi:hypothetical protein
MILNQDDPIGMGSQRLVWPPPRVGNMESSPLPTIEYEMVFVICLRLFFAFRHRLFL